MKSDRFSEHSQRDIDFFFPRIEVSYVHHRTKRRFDIIFQHSLETVLEVGLPLLSPMSQPCHFTKENMIWRLNKDDHPVEVAQRVEGIPMGQRPNRKDGTNRPA